MIEIKPDGTVLSYDSENLTNGDISCLIVGHLNHGFVVVDHLYYGKDADSMYSRLFTLYEHAGGKKQ